MTARYLALDLEAVLDADLGRRAYGLTGTDREVRAALRARHREKTQGRSDFPPPLWWRVVAVGLATYDPETGGTKAAARASADESDLIRWALSALRSQPRLLSFNGRGFDLPVLMHRAMAHALPAEALFGSRAAKQWDTYGYRFGGPHLDVMDRLTGYGAGGAAGLHELAVACGLPGKGAVTGADVEDLFEADAWDAIKCYVKDDVQQTLDLGLRLARVMGELRPERPASLCSPHAVVEDSDDIPL